MSAQKQKDMWWIPRWDKAPEWAEWLQFCKTRGWVFCTMQPHVFGDGHMTCHGHRFVLACDVQGMTFKPNRKCYSGQGRPFADEDVPATLSTVTPPRDLRTKLGDA